MNNLLVLIFSLSLNSFSSEVVTYVNSKNKEFKILNDTKNNLLISSNCNKKCLAYTSLKNIKLKFNNASFPQNPGAVICEEQLGSELVSLKASNGKITSFCKFKDKSLIETSLLLYHAKD